MFLPIFLSFLSLIITKTVFLFFSCSRKTVLPAPLELVRGIFFKQVAGIFEELLIVLPKPVEAFLAAALITFRLKMFCRGSNSAPLMEAVIISFTSIYFLDNSVPILFIFSWRLGVTMISSGSPMTIFGDSTKFMRALLTT